MSHTNTATANATQNTHTHAEYDGYLTDIAILIGEGNDYDDMCQKATDAIAKHEGIPTLEEDENAYDNEEYRQINDLVNERVSAILGE